MMKYKNIVIYNIIAMLVMIMLDIVYLVVGIPFVFKTLASVFFVVTGIVNLVLAYRLGFDSKYEKRFAILMLIGLVFAMLGDIFLIPPFPFALGAGLFAIGHIFFFVAYLQLSKFKWSRDFVGFVAVLIPVLELILLYDGFKFDTLMFVVVIVYAIIISLMLSKSIGNLYDKNMSKLSKWLIFAGSLMFFLSDACLLFHIFAGWGKWIDVLCLAFYYPAEIILASSIFFASRKEKK